MRALRHGARAARRTGRRGGRRRAARHAAALLGRRGAHAARPRARNGGGVSAPVRSLVRARVRDPRRARGGMADRRARVEVRPRPQPEHVHADRARHRRVLRAQRRRDGSPRRLSGVVPGPPVGGSGLLRGCRRDHRARAPRTGPRAPGPSSHPARGACAPRSRAAHRTSPPCERCRGGRADRAAPSGGPAAGAPGGAASSRWRHRGGSEQRRRVDAHRRADPGREGSRGERSRRDAQRCRRVHHARRARGGRDVARPDRPAGLGSAPDPGADPAARRPRRGGLRAHRDRGGGRDVRRLGPLRPRARARARLRRGGGGPHHRLSLRPRACDSDVDHGGDRSGGPGRRARARGRGTRDARPRRHAARRQDGNAHRG